MSCCNICNGKLRMNVRAFCLMLGLLCLLPVNSEGQSMSPKHNLPSLYNDDGDDFIIIAHRGASAYYPENTMIAFKKALEMGAEMIELDVMMSKDGVPVVFHDAQLNAHTTGHGPLKNYTLQELQKLDAGSWFDAQFSDQQIPTLKKVLAFAAGNIALNIEIKTEAVTDSIENGIEQKVLRLVKDYGMENYVLISSFDYRAVKRLKQLDSSISVALLYEQNQSNHLLPHQLVDRYNADAFNCSFRQLNPKWIADIHEYHIPAFIYTVDNKDRMKKLIAAGVTGIFTNKPDVLVDVVRDFYPPNR